MLTVYSFALLRYFVCTVKPTKNPQTLVEVLAESRTKHSGTRKRKEKYIRVHTQC